MNRRRNIILGIVMACCLGIGLLYFQKPVVLEIGVFTGSNWDVPSPDNGKMIDKAIKKFEKQHPNVQVKYTSGIIKSDYSKWISNKAVSGDLPDVFMVLSDDISVFSEVGILQPLNSIIANDGDFKTSDYYSSSFETGTVNGKQYALPYESVPTLMFVNRTLLEENGIEIPDENWTWDDFYSICQQVTKDTDGDGVVDQFGEYGYTWQHALSSNGGTLFNESGTKSYVDSNQMTQAVEFVRKLSALNTGETVTSEMFDKGLVVFCPMLFSEYRTYKPYPWSVKKYSTFEWDCIPMPAGPNGDNTSEMDTLMFGMSKESHNKKLAWEFLKMLSCDEKIQTNLFKYSQGVSVLKKVSTSSTIEKYIQEDAPKGNSYNLGFFDQTMEHAVVVKKFNGYDQVFSIVDSEIQRLITTDEDIENALLTLNNEVEISLGKK